MNLPFHPRRSQAGYTRREWLVGTVVVLALLVATARELRLRPAPTCGAACSPCGGDAVVGLENWVAAQTNAPARPPAPVGSVR
jgi:hypothetical protein